ERAVYLYRKMGFQIEAVMPRGARTDLGEFLDVYKMSYLIE
ncbi:GNAT family N-acetyltransferase, partial [Enterococcus faecium]